MQELQALMEANDYINDMQKYGYNHAFTELSFSRAKRNYERLINNLQAHYQNYNNIF